MRNTLPTNEAIVNEDRPAPAQLPLYVGTSGWAYTIWKPDFYPKEVASKNFLK
jgi:hypothetical protein